MEYSPDEADRKRLREVHGTVQEGAAALADHLSGRDHGRVIAVGDRVTSDLTEQGLEPDIAITDGQEQRSTVTPQSHARPEHDMALTTQNPAGSITEDAWCTVREAIAHRCGVGVRVDGEEDLLALPAILMAGPDALIVHGHWQEGAVVVRPDQRMKAWVRDIVGIEQREHTIVGGTWDRLHAGHRYLLLAALEAGGRVSVGVTGDTFAAEHTDHHIEPVAERRQAIDRFLDAYGAGGRARTVVIEDIYGPAAGTGTHLLVTDETRENGERVNEHRRDTGEEPLELIAVDRITGPDGEVISSSRIRAGTIDREGRPDPDPAGP